jgi:hypothetical protein
VLWCVFSSVLLGIGLSVNWIIILGFYHLIQQVQGSIVSDVQGALMQL